MTDFTVSMVKRCIENIIYFYNFLTDLNDVSSMSRLIEKYCNSFFSLKLRFSSFPTTPHEVFVGVIANVNNLVYSAFNLTR